MSGSGAWIQAIIQGLGMAAGGMATRSAAKTRGRLFLANRKRALAYASMLKKVGKQDVAKLKKDIGEFKSAQKAVAGGSGLTTESFTEAIADTARKGSIDVQTMQWQNKVERRQLENLAALMKWRAYREKEQAKWQIISSSLQGISGMNWGGMTS